MNITGGYFQVLDFVNRLDSLPRIIVVDSINVSGGAVSQLTVALTARMFVSANKPVAGSGATTTTTSTTVPGATTTTSAAGG